MGPSDACSGAHGREAPDEEAELREPVGSATGRSDADNADHSAKLSVWPEEQAAEAPSEGAQVPLPPGLHRDLFPVAPKTGQHAGDQNACEHWAESVASAESAAREVADFVAYLVVRADMAFTAWTVTIPLNTNTLPDSQVQITLTPAGLALRFRSTEQGSLRLIARFQGMLMGLLQRTPGLPDPIYIEIE